MQKLADTQPALRELKPEECQQVSGGLTDASGYSSSLKDFPVIAWPRINVAIDAKIFTTKAIG